MSADLTIAMLAVWAAGLVTLPLWVLVAGAVAARRREAREAREPAPRPAEDHAPEPRVVAGLRDAERAFSMGLAAGRAFAPTSAEEARDVLASHHDVIADVQRAPDGGFRVLVRASRAGLGAPVVGEPVCHFDRGVVAALFESVAGTAVSVRESRCRGAGDNRCAFDVAILPSSEPDPEAAPEPTPDAGPVPEAPVVPGALTVALLSRHEARAGPEHEPSAGGGA